VTRIEQVASAIDQWLQTHTMSVMIFSIIGSFVVGYLIFETWSCDDE